MGVAKCPGGVDGSLVGVEDYLGSLLFSFAHPLFQLFKAVVVWLIASPLRCDAVGQDLVVEGIQEDRPLPVSRSNFEHGHVGDHELKGCSGIPMSPYLIRK